MRKRIAQCRMGPPTLHLHTRCKNCGSELLLCSAADFIVVGKDYSRHWSNIPRYKFSYYSIYSENFLSREFLYFRSSSFKYKEISKFATQCSKCFNIYSMKQDCCNNRKFVERFKH